MSSRHRVILVSFLHSLEVGFSFTKWPNHITIVPYFFTENLEKIIQEIKTICGSLNKIPYVVSEVAYFGKEKNVEVSKITPNIQIVTLHQLLLNLAIKSDSDMDLKYSGENFAPHITHNDNPFPQKGDSGELKRLYLVENDGSEAEQKSSQVKRVLAVFDFPETK